MKEKKQKPYSVVLKRFLQINHASVPGFMAAVLFLVLSVIFGSGISLCTGEMLDAVNGRRMDIFFVGLAVLCGLQGMKLIVGYQVNYRVNHLSEVCIRRMRSFTYDRISNASMRWLDGNKLGDIISRVNGDLNSLTEAVNSFLTWQISDFVNLIVGMIICFVLNWKLSLISFSILPIVGYLQFASGKPIAGLGQKRAIAEGRVSAAFMDFLGGLSISKAFGMEKEMTEKYDIEVDAAVKANTRSFAMEFVLFPLQMLMNFLPNLCITGVGAYFVIKDQMTLGGLLSYLLIATVASNAIGGLSWQVRDIYNTIGIAERIFEIWDVETETTGGSITETKTEIPVEFRNVHFGYNDELEILHDINFRIQPGEQVALVGASGSGKSTIMKLLSGFYRQTEGDILLFGQENQEWNTQALRDKIAYVGQDAFLFPGTILSNVLLGRSDADKKEALDMLDAVGLTGVLDVNAPIGERGVLISGGQRQRICIARALLKNASMVLLDEPTSALDTESEFQVQEALRHLTKGKTTITIAHRLSAIHNVDRIICLHEGRIAESGTHTELMKKKGIYCALYEKQVKQEADYEDER